MGLSPTEERCVDRSLSMSIATLLLLSSQAARRRSVHKFSDIPILQNLGLKGRILCDIDQGIHPKFITSTDHCNLTIERVNLLSNIPLPEKPAYLTTRVGS